MNVSRVLAALKTVAKPTRAPLLAVVGGLLATGAAFWKAQSDVEERFRLQFMADASLRANIIMDALDQRLASLDALRRLYLSSSEVSPDEFRAFTKPEPGQSLGWVALLWIPRLEAADRVQVEADAQEKQPGFRFTQVDPVGNLIPCPDKPVYYPALVVEPLTGNERLAGFDCGSESVVHDALARCCSSGQATASESFNSAPLGLRGEGSVLVLMPVFRKGQPSSTAEERQAALEGYVGGIFRLGELLTNALRFTPPVGLPTDVLDLSAPADKRLLYHWMPRLQSKPGRNPAHVASRRVVPHEPRFPFGGRQWQVVVSASPAYRQAQRSTAYYLILPVGLAITGLLGFYLQMLVVHRDTAERRYYDLINNLKIGVYRNTGGSEGRFLEANPAMIQMFEAASKDEFMKCKVAGLYVDPTQRARFVQDITQRGEVHDYEVELRTCKGRRFWGSVTANLRRSWTGGVFFDGVIEDITERKQAELTLQRERILLRTLIDNLPDAVYVKDVEGRKTVANRADLRNMGRTSEAEVLGKTDSDLFPAESAAHFMADDKAVIQNGQPILSREERFVDPSGDERWLLTSKLPLRSEEGKIIGLVGIGRDITLRKRAEDRLRLLSRAIEQSPASVIITDPQGVIEYVNPKFTEVTGYTLEEARGQKPSLLKGGQTAPEAYKALWNTLKNGQVWQGEFCNRRKDGTLFWETASISPVTDANGQVTHLLAVKEDITSLKQTEEALRQAKEMAESASLAKSEFLANMSHEIRTPLNGVIGMTGLLLDTELTPAQREFAETIRNSGETLLALLNDVLDFSKIEAGRLDVENLSFDLRETVEDTADILALRAQQKGLEFVCVIDPDVPDVVTGDPGRIRQVLTNLTGNAIKFTSRGEVSIRVSVDSGSAATPRIRFQVADSGIGIPEAEQKKLFAPFTQVDASTTRRYGGTGLGLSISKRLVEMMGGEIGLRSAEGKGSVFWFSVPLPKASGTAVGVARPWLELAGRRVLLVDDHETNRRLLVLLLGAWGCETEEADHAAAALQKLRAAQAAGHPFDLALLDMHMPEMDGLQLGLQIKRDPALARIPLVMLTSLAERGEAARLMEIGFAGFLTKPIRQSLLQRVVAKALGLLREEHRPSVSVGANNSGLPGWQRSKFRLLLAEDNVTNQRVAQAILHKLGYRADVVANGREAIQSLKTIPYDLVLMDCQMPEMDGYETTRAIRNPATGIPNPQMPIIAMTAYAMQGDRDLCLQAGMNDYVSKPVQQEELADTLDRWLGQVTQASRDPLRLGRPDAEMGQRVFDEKEFVNRLMDDRELARSITRSFIAEASDHVRGLKAALERSNVEIAVRHAHSLKGSSANLGAHELRDTAMQMERLLRAGECESAALLMGTLDHRFEVLLRVLEAFLAQDTQKNDKR